MAKVYALFVGINNYMATDQGIKVLNGCVEDIDAIETLFRRRITPRSLELKVLRDGEATRAGIIDGFRGHLRRAGKKDVALFYYAGHGSLEFVPEEWQQLEPSGMNQTIIPVDSRLNNVFDIADKELSALIHDVASSGAQVVTIFDCCNSGGVTRGAGEPAEPGSGVARRAPAANRARTIDDYLDLARELYDPTRVAAEGVPHPRVVTISACQDNQEAKEFPGGVSPSRGAFTTALEEVLQAIGPSATYIDLVNALRMKVRDRALDQVPNLSVSGGASGHDVFLKGHAGRRDLTVDVDAGGHWWLSAGVIDGIPVPARGQVTEVAIHERGAFDESDGEPAPVTTAVVTEVLEDRAQLKLRRHAAALDPSRQYLGAITRLGGPALPVIVEAADGGAAADQVRARLVGSSAHFAVVTRAASGPSLTVVAGDDTVDVLDENRSPLDGLRYTLDDVGLDTLAASCAHLALWYGIRDRAVEGSRLNEKVRIELVPLRKGEATPPPTRAALNPRDGAVTLAYEGEVPPRVQFRLHNESDERLFVALLDLTDSFRCAKMFAEWIPAGGTGFVDGGKAQQMTIPKWRPPATTSTTDYFKVVAAINDFDPQRWTMPALLGPKTRDAEPATAEAASRRAGGVDAFWGTTLLKVVTARSARR